MTRESKANGREAGLEKLLVVGMGFQLSHIKANSRPRPTVARGAENTEKSQKTCWVKSLRALWLE